MSCSYGTLKNLFQKKEGQILSRARNVLLLEWTSEQSYKNTEDSYYQYCAQPHVICKLWELTVHCTYPGHWWKCRTKWVQGHIHWRDSCWLFSGLEMTYPSFISLPSQDEAFLQPPYKVIALMQFSQSLCDIQVRYVSRILQLEPPSEKSHCHTRISPCSPADSKSFTHKCLLMCLFTIFFLKTTVIPSGEEILHTDQQVSGRIIWRPHCRWREVDNHLSSSTATICDRVMPLSSSSAISHPSLFQTQVSNTGYWEFMISKRLIKIFWAICY